MILIYQIQQIQYYAKMKNYAKILYMAVFIIIIFIPNKFHSQIIEVTLSVSTINAYSIYSFSIYDINLQNSNGTITIGFPSQLYTLSNIICYITDNRSSVFNCSVIGSYVIIQYTISNLQCSSNQICSLSLESIQNPSCTQDLNFSYSFNSNPTSLYFKSNPLTPDSLLECLVSFVPSTVSTIAIATFNLTMKNQVDTNGSITVKFPDYWDYSNNSYSSTTEPIISNSASCYKVQGVVLNQLSSCFAISMLQLLSIRAAFYSQTLPNTTIIFNVTEIKTPPTQYSQSRITISTSMANNSLVDSSQCKVAGVSAQTIFLSIPNSLVVGVSGQFFIRWTSNSVLMVKDSITITFPNNMQFSYLSNITIIYGSNKQIKNITISDGNSSQKLILTIEIIENPYIISQGVTISISNLFATCLVDTSIRNVLLTVSRSGYLIQSGSLLLQPLPSQLSNANISANQTAVSTPMTVQFSFTTSNSLDSGCSIQVQIPSEIGLTGLNPKCQIISLSTPSIVSPLINCTFDNQTNIVNIFQFIKPSQQPLSTNSSLILTIQNTFINPITDKPTSPFIISTYSSANTLIDQNSDLVYIATSDSIENISITPSSYQVGNSNVYTLEYNLMRNIDRESTIVVVFPEEVSIPSANQSYTYSINNSNFQPVQHLFFQFNNTASLTFSGIISPSLPANTTIKILFNSVTNPNSFKQSDSFQIMVQYNGFSSQQIRTGLTVTMNIPAEFHAIIPEIVGGMNGANQSYTFYIKPRIAIKVQDLIIIQIVDSGNDNNQISFLSPNTSCMIQQIDCPCNFTNNMMTIRVLSAMIDVSGGTEYQLVIRYMRLARTFNSSSFFNFSSKTSDGYDVQTRTIQSAQNTFPNYIQQLNMTILSLPSQLNQLLQMQFTVQTFNGLDMLNDQYLVISIPASFTYVGNGSSQLCNDSNLVCNIYNNNSNNIKVASSHIYGNVGLVYTFTITLSDNSYVSPQNFNFENPKNASEHFNVSTYTNNNLLIDITDSFLVNDSLAIFYLSCPSTCKTCNGSNCLSCYQVGSGYFPNATYSGYNILNSANQCVNSCSSGEYNNEGFCQKCISPCVTCVDGIICMSCVDGFYYINSSASITKCEKFCPNRTYADDNSNSCLNCSLDCYNCINQSTTCISCVSYLFLYKNKCQIQCPSNTVADQTNKCIPCDVGCLGNCTNSPSNCDDCKIGYFRPSSDSLLCVEQCPTGTVGNSSSQRCQCDQLCLTCSGTLTNCTLCNLPLYLFGNQCKKQCPNKTYSSIIANNTHACFSCRDPNCTLCNSNSCLSCQNSSFLYIGTCVSHCPKSSIQWDYECILCPTGCEECEQSNNTYNMSDNQDNFSIYCISCFKDYLVQDTSCVKTCKQGYFNLNNTICVTQCPVQYYIHDGTCQIIDNTIRSNIKIISFSYIIVYLLIVGLGICIKRLFPITVLSSLLMSIGSIIEILSTFTLIIDAIITLKIFTIGIVILIVTVSLIYLCNFIHFFFISQILNNDEIFLNGYQKKACGNTIIRLISMLTYYKFHEIVFSNMLVLKVFTNRVQLGTTLQPLNILLVISLFLSVFLVVGSSLICVSVRQNKLMISIYIQSICCMAIVILNAIPTIFVLRRKPADYEKDISKGIAPQFQTTNQISMNEQQSGVDQYLHDKFMNRNLASLMGQRRKNYYFNNQRNSQRGEDPFESNLEKRQFGMAISTQIPSNSAHINKLDDGQLINTAFGNKIKNRMIDYTGYDLDPNLLALSEDSLQFRELSVEMKSKIRLAKTNTLINRNSENFRKLVHNLGINEQRQQEMKKKWDQYVEELPIDQIQQLEGHLRTRKNSTSKTKKLKAIEWQNSINEKLSDKKLVVNDQISAGRYNMYVNNLKKGQIRKKIKNKNKINKNKNKVLKMRYKNDDRYSGTQRYGIDNLESYVQSKQIDECDEDMPTFPTFWSKIQQNQQSKYQDLKVISQNTESFAQLTKFQILHPNKTFSNQSSTPTPFPKQDQYNQMNSSRQYGNFASNRKNKNNNRNLEFSCTQSSISKNMWSGGSEMVKTGYGDHVLNHEHHSLQINMQNRNLDGIDDNNHVLPDENIGYDDEQQINENSTEDKNMKRYCNQEGKDSNQIVEEGKKRQKIKQLQKIYLPRLEIPKTNRKNI